MLGILVGRRLSDLNGLSRPRGARRSSGTPSRLDLHKGLADGTEDVGSRRPHILIRLGLHLARYLAQIDCRRTAVEADIAGLRDPMVQVRPARVELDLGEQRTEEAAATAVRTDEEHRCSLRNAKPHAIRRRSVAIPATMTRTQNPATTPTSSCKAGQSNRRL